MVFSLFASPVTINNNKVEATTGSITLNVAELANNDKALANYYSYDSFDRTLDIIGTDITLTGNNNNLSINILKSNIKLIFQNANIKSEDEEAIYTRQDKSTIRIHNSIITGGADSPAIVSVGNSNSLTINNSVINGGSISTENGSPSVITNGQKKIYIKGVSTLQGTGKYPAISYRNKPAIRTLSPSKDTQITLINGSMPAGNELTEPYTLHVDHSRYSILTNMTFDNSYQSTKEQSYLKVEPNTTQTMKFVTPTTKIHTAKKTIYMKKKTSMTVPIEAYSENNTESKLTWKSSKPKVASVNKKGKIKAKKVGKTKITVTAENGKKLTIKVNVVKKKTPVKKLKIKGVKSKIKVGKSKYLTVTTTPKKATNTVVKWKSSNTKVLYVDKAGRINARKKGKVKLTAKIGKKKVTKVIKVVK